MFKRLLPVAGILGLLSIALAGSAAAGGGGGYGGPGLFKFVDSSAYANFTDPLTGNSYTSAYVDRGAQSFKLKRTPGAPVVEVYGTVLNVIEQSDTSFGYGCWIIPDSAFVIAADQSSASVNVHATSTMQCPGFLVSGTTGGKPGLQSAIGYGGGGPGGPPNQITDIVVNLTWTGSGAAWSNVGSNVSHCQSFTATYQSHFDYEFATATGTLGSLTGTSDPFAEVSHSTFMSNSNSTPSSACNPFGF
jgi:hypothetical protein